MYCRSIISYSFKGVKMSRKKLLSKDTLKIMQEIRELDNRYNLNSDKINKVLSLLHDVYISAIINEELKEPYD